jgi:tetratricopeptide (TPR) repeat protein
MLEEETEERLAISKKINGLKDQIKQFKQDVLRFAEQFNQIEINTERLKQAKEFFDKGEIGEARAILEDDLEQMQDEHNRLLQEREKFEKGILPKLKNNSNEFFILALSKQTDYRDSNWFESTCTYFEKSIEAFPTEINVFEFAVFLQNHNQFLKAENYYQKFLTEFPATINLLNKAGALNNLAVLHRAKNELESALQECEEALEIYRNLAIENPSAYLPDVAMTLINIGIYYQASVSNREVSINCLIEAITIILPIVEKVPYTQTYMHSAITVLQKWDLSMEDIERLIAERLQNEHD